MPDEAPDRGVLEARADSPVVPVQHARGFRVEPSDGFTIVDVLQPWRDAEVHFRYVLVPRGHQPPDGFPDAVVVETPVRSIVVLSTTHIGPLAELGLSDRIVGVAGGEWVSSTDVRDRLADGSAADLGPPGRLDYERLAVLAPDMVMALGMGAGEDAAFEKLSELGVPVVLNGEYAESDPLARAEWIKFVAAFFDRNAEAQARFEDINTRYQALVSQVGGVDERPTVFLGTNWQGTWYAPGGESYMARFLRDAGADYLWKDTPSDGVLPLDFEAVIDRAIDAEYWLNTSSWRTLKDAPAEDERYRIFGAWKTGNVYNHTRRLSPTGGNDFYETGVVRPDLVLADLIKIFHPDLVPEHAFVYYEQLQATDASPSNGEGPPSTP